MLKPSEYLRQQVTEAVQSTVWFRTAPGNVKQTLEVKVVGVEMRKGNSLLGGETSGHCLIAEATCGIEERRFAWAFQLGLTIEIDR